MTLWASRHGTLGSVVDGLCCATPRGAAVLFHRKALSIASMPLSEPDVRLSRIRLPTNARSVELRGHTRAGMLRLIRHAVTRRPLAIGSAGSVGINLRELRG